MIKLLAIYHRTSAFHLPQVKCEQNRYYKILFIILVIKLYAFL